MPELPEVETVVRDLRPLLTGRTLTAVRIGKQRLRRPWKKAWTEAIVGATVTAIRRRGKWIILEIQSERRGSTPPSFLLVHLGMTGQFTVADSTTPLPDHTHLVFDLSDGQQLRFRDVRRFGSVELFPDEVTVTAFLDERLGPEPFDLDAATFREAVQRSTRPVKAILLDQTIVAGVGNIYADEALHRAGLHPERRGPTITNAETNRLREAVMTVLLFAIEHRGSTIRDYIGGSGLRGGFQDEFRVYGRTGQPCGTCRMLIEVVRVAGRSSHYCPKCQKSG